ncbi:ABC transporter permease [Cytophagales bacterium WSM2-2]|nr:ABC transporter permease [Cytophagales bacterium WSM2-2]
MNKLLPPKRALQFLRWFCREDYVEEIEGDLTEIFEKEYESSTRHAQWKFAWSVIKYFRPQFLKPFRNYYQPTSFGMYKNYFVIAWRNLLKKKGYSAINIFGLALGIACCLLITMYVNYERSFDNYHTKGDRIYRVIHGWADDKNSKGKSTESYWVWGNAPIGQTLHDNFPEIDKVVQFSGRADILLSLGEKSYQEEGVFFMDSTVFDVFTWKMLKGDPKTALSAPFSIVLTESTAKKYFGNEDPLGKSLKGTDSPGRANAGEYLVTGVMEDVPENSHFRFNALLSMSTFRKSRPDIFSAWGYVDFYTYFLAKDHFDRAKFEKKAPGIIAKQINDPENKSTIVIEPLKDMYLGTVCQRQPGETGSIANIYIFSIIGVFVLAIAIINFMNLSTARSMERGKEVGIRKSIGAERGNLVSQFLGESFIIVSVSMLFAVVIAMLTLPGMNNITGRVLDFTHYVTLLNVAMVLASTIVIGVIAGSYPAFVLSSYRPATVLKGMSKSGKSGVTLRRALVILQFSLSISLIAGTMIVSFQMNNIVNKDLGFDKERMLILDYNYDGTVNRKREVLKTELEANPNISSVAFSRSVPGSYFPNAYTEIITSDGAMKGMSQPIFQVGMDFINHYGLKLAAGRSYSRDHPSDTIGGIVINEAAAKQYGYANPADIVGKKYKQWGREGEVIGVVKDFNYISLHRNIEPLTLPLEPFACRYISLKVKSADIPATIEEVHKIWTKLAPHRPFLYSFLDEDFNRQYQKDFNFKTLFSTFSSLAIFIACLGLLGLATYTTEIRTKEIGIRKVLGANVSSIVTLLSKDFILLVIIAMLVATPVAWYSMDRWLQGFAYRVEIHFWIFILSGFLAIAIAALTISLQVIKAAGGNPVNSLRSE